MRLREYIEEIQDHHDYERIKGSLENDCQQFLRYCRGTKLYVPIYRGVKRRVSVIDKFKVRTDRKPKDTPTKVHQILDELFRKHHGWKARSNGVFTVADIHRAYYTAYIFVPIGSYKYLWNPDIKDLYMKFERIFYKHFGVFSDSIYDEEVTDILDYDDDSFTKDIENIIRKYRNDNLKECVTQHPKVEITFKCKEYYLINKDYVHLYKRIVDETI